MAYTKQTWNNDAAPPISASRLGYIEDGIFNAAAAADTAGTTATSANTKATATEAEVVEARGAAVDLAARLAEIVAAGGNQTQIDALQGEIDAVEAEILAARGTETDLNTRISNITQATDAALSFKEDSGVAADLVNTHVGAAAPHDGYQATYVYDTASSSYVVKATRTKVFIQYTGDPDPTLSPLWADGDIGLEETV